MSVGFHLIIIGSAAEQAVVSPFEISSTALSGCQLHVFETAVVTGWVVVLADCTLLATLTGHNHDTSSALKELVHHHLYPPMSLQRLTKCS